MRHQKTLSKLNRKKSHREAMFMNMANSLFSHESIKTTQIYLHADNQQVRKSYYQYV